MVYIYIFKFYLVSIYILLFIFNNLKNELILKYFLINKIIMGIGDWGLGIGDWGLGIGVWGLVIVPNPQSPIPNPQSPIPNPQSPCDILLKISLIIFL